MQQPRKRTRATDSNTIHFHGLYQQNPTEAHAKKLKAAAEQLLAQQANPGKVIPTLQEAIQDNNKNSSADLSLAALAHIASTPHKELVKLTQSPIYKALLPMLLANLGSQFLPTAAAEDVPATEDHDPTVAFKRDGDNCTVMFDVTEKQFERPFFELNKEIGEINELIHNFVVDLPKQISNSSIGGQWQPTVVKDIFDGFILKDKFTFPVAFCDGSDGIKGTHKVDEPFADLLAQACVDPHTLSVMTNTTQNLLNQLANTHHLKSSESCATNKIGASVVGGLVACILLMVLAGCTYFKCRQRQRRALYYSLDDSNDPLSFDRSQYSGVADGRDSLYSPSSRANTHSGAQNVFFNENDPLSNDNTTLRTSSVSMSNSSNDSD